MKQEKTFLERIASFFLNSKNNDNKKYKLSNETIKVEGKTLYRIEALKDFAKDSDGNFAVVKGQKGGFVQSEKNLSHFGDCWVGDNAMVFDNAKVTLNAFVGGKAKISENALVSDNAFVVGKSEISGNAKILDKAQILHEANIFGHATIEDKAEVSGNAKVFGSATISDNATVLQNAQVSGCAHIYDNSSIYNNAKVEGNTSIGLHSSIGGNAIVGDNRSWDRMYYGGINVSGDIKVLENLRNYKGAELNSLQVTKLLDGKTVLVNDIPLPTPDKSKKTYNDFIKLNPTTGKLEKVPVTNFESSVQLAINNGGVLINKETIMDKIQQKNNDAPKPKLNNLKVNKPKGFKM